MNPEQPNITAAKEIPFPRQELHIVLVYVILATIWIMTSDYVVEWATGDPHASARLQTVKGLKFVVTSGALLYLVLNRSFQQRRQAQAQESSIRERFELIARAASDALWDWNLKSNEIWWSEGFQKNFGHPKEVVEKTIESWTSRIHPEDRERTIQRIHEVIDHGDEVWWDEYRFLRRDGSYAEVLDRGYVIKDAAGKPVRMVGGITDVTRRNETEKEIARSRHRLRALSARLERVKEEEHTRISRQLHDELGQMLTGLKMDLRWIEKRLEAKDDRSLNPMLDKLVVATELTDQCLASVQDISCELRPDLLDQLGLAEALSHEAGRMQDRTGIRCVVDLPDPPPTPPPQIATALFRITREALVNVIRHSQAKQVNLALREDAKGFVLTITDDGCGLPAEQLENPKSLGLFGMRERAGQLGGEVTFGPGPGPCGTTVTLRLPHPKGA